MQKLRASLVGSEGCQRFPFSKPVVGQSIALHAVPAYRASTYVLSAFPAHSTYFLQISSIRNDGMCIENLNSESEFLLVVPGRTTFCFA